MNEIQYKLMSDTAKAPQRAHYNDAGADLFSDEDMVLVEHWQVAKVGTGVQVAIPDGYYGRIAEKSGLGTKGIQVLGGVIDSGYRGELIVCVTRAFASQPYKIKRGA